MSYWRLCGPAALHGLWWETACNNSRNDIWNIPKSVALLWCELGWWFQPPCFNGASWWWSWLWSCCLWGWFEHLLPCWSGGAEKREGGRMQKRLFGHRVPKILLQRGICKPSQVQAYSFCSSLQSGLSTGIQLCIRWIYRTKQMQSTPLCHNILPSCPTEAIDEYANGNQWNHLPMFHQIFGHSTKLGMAIHPKKKT